MCFYNLIFFYFFVNNGVYLLSDRFSSEKTVATSFLRIRNIFNESAKQEIDPVYSNLKQSTTPSKGPIHFFKSHRVLSNPYGNNGVYICYLTT